MNMAQTKENSIVIIKMPDNINNSKVNERRNLLS
jgi:hypothetical protein